MPDFQSVVRKRLASLNLHASEEATLSDELTQHLEDRYRELLSGGAGETAAYNSAVSQLDDLHSLRAVRRMPTHDPVPAGDLRRGSALEDLSRDLRYAGRTMRKSPLFVLVVILTLGFGIGANTTVFTVLNTLLINPLPVRNSSELASVGLAPAGSESKPSPPQPLSYLDLKDYQNGNQVFRAFAGYTSSRIVTFQPHGSPERMFTEFVTAGYFDVLGLRPAAGRFFTAEEDAPGSEHAVAVLNYADWQRRFGGASDIVGRSIVLNNLPFTVIGVAPPNFIGVNAIFGPDLWIPARMAERLLPNEMAGVLTQRAKTAFLGIGRLKPNTARSLAQSNLAAIAADLAREYPAADEGRTATVRPIRDVLFGSASSGSAPIVFGGAVLLAVVGIVLLIACSNVANLLLARSAARAQEIAVRLAMGASRSRLVRQLLTESVVLGCLGGLLGLAIGYAGLRLIFGALPGSANFPVPKLDETVLLFALVVSLATGFLFGAIPAYRASRAGVSDVLKEGARTAGRSRRRITLANALIVAQVAFSFLLLLTAALFLRSIQRAYEIDPGFQTAHLALFMTTPGQSGYSRQRTKEFYQSARERVERIPGVESVSWSSNLPLWARSANGLEVEGRVKRSRADQLATIVSTVDLAYFETAGVAIASGRAFTPGDREFSTPVAIVNQKLAADFWPGENPLGRRIQLPGEKTSRQIVGVARNANYTNWAEPPQLCVYLPLEQHPNDAMILFVRTKGDPRPFLVPVQREVLAAGPEILIGDTRIGRDIVQGGLFQARMGVSLLGVFGLLALLLASVGLYGIMAYGVNQRKREIGLRMALGAAQSTVLQLVLKQGMELVLTGIAIGFAASLFVEQLLSRMLFGVSANDPLSVAAAAIVLVAVGLLACYLPARWASRVDPLVALREG